MLGSILRTSLPLVEATLSLLVSQACDREYRNVRCGWRVPGQESAGTCRRLTYLGNCAHYLTIVLRVRLVGARVYLCYTVLSSQLIWLSCTYGISKLGNR